MIEDLGLASFMGALIGAIVAAIIWGFGVLTGLSNLSVDQVHACILMFAGLGALGIPAALLFSSGTSR